MALGWTRSFEVLSSPKVYGSDKCCHAPTVCVSGTGAVSGAYLTGLPCEGSEITSASTRGLTACINTFPVSSRRRGCLPSKAPWRIILPDSTVYQLSPRGPRGDLPRASHPSETELGGKLSVDDSQHGTLSRIAGCQRVETWTQEKCTWDKGGPGIDWYLNPTGSTLRIQIKKAHSQHW